MNRHGKQYLQRELMGRPDLLEQNIHKICTGDLAMITGRINFPQHQKTHIFNTLHSIMIMTHGFGTAFGMGFKTLPNPVFRNLGYLKSDS